MIAAFTAATPALAGGTAYAAGAGTAALPCPPNPAAGAALASVVVPAGKVCTLVNDTLTGSVTVDQGGELLVEGTRIGGSIAATKAAAVFITTTAQNASSIVGSVKLVAPTHWGLCDVGIGGSFSVTGQTMGSPPPVAAPDCPTPSAMTAGPTVGGSVLFSGDQVFEDFEAFSVGGNVTAKNNTGGGTLKNLTVKGSLHCTANTPKYTDPGSTAVGTDSCGG